MAKQEHEKLSELLDVFSSLSDPNRVRALVSLKDRELCVCQITELLHLAPSTVSKHLTMLRQCGLVESRKQGRWTHYRLSKACREGEFASITGQIFESLRNDRQLRDDARSLKRILQLDPEELCRNQCRR